MTDDEEIVQAFLEESREGLDQLDRDLVDLELRPGDPALLAQIFRTIHTIKGTCGFLGYHRLEKLTHAGEDVLGALRAGEIVLDEALTTSLLRLIDAVRAVLRSVADDGTEGDQDHSVVTADLVRHLPTLPAADPTGDVAGPVVTAQHVSEAPLPGDEDAASVTRTAEGSVRVDVAVLDRLQDLVGELVLARSQLGAVLADDEGPLAQPYRQLRLVTAELQDGVMRARLQPVGTVTGRLSRIARDLATALDKRVIVEVEGADVGVDKAINEALRDPLLHLVRNAIDHGVESPAERLAAGKPAHATLLVRACHLGGRLHVEVSDDGRGVDSRALAAAAVAGGTLSAERAAALDPADCLELLFQAGLSTKAEVSTVSGRGVGMDVVRSSLEQVGGSIAVSSAPGIGTSFRIDVPLTLAIVPAVVVIADGGRYAVPQDDVEEVVHVAAADLVARVDQVAGAQLLRLRGFLLPLVHLGSQLGGLAPAPPGPLLVLVTRSRGRCFGVVVDAVVDTIEAVVKPLPPAFRAVGLYAGVTIMADGHACMVLDVVGLATAADVEAGRAMDAPATGFLESVVGTAIAPVRSATMMDQPDEVTGASVLLATGTDGGLLAFPLEAVRRLEHCATGSAQKEGRLELLPYGDRILPLVRVTDELRGSTQAGPAIDHKGVTECVVVCATAVGLVGFVVDTIQDVVQRPTALVQPAHRAGVATRLLIDARVAEVVDVEALAYSAGLRCPA